MRASAQVRAITAPSLSVPIGLQREPGLERAEAARQIRTEIAGPGRAGGEPAGLAPQIGRRRGEGSRCRSPSRTSRKPAS